MSNYEPIVPTTNPFNFHGASIEIETDKEAGGGNGLGYFIEGSFSNSEPASSHFIGIKSDKQLIINRCDFTAIVDSDTPIQKFTIESSIDGKHFNALYTGVIRTRTLSKYDWLPFSCEFNPTRCKYIRCTFSSTPYEIYIFWGALLNFMVLCQSKIHSYIPIQMLHMEYERKKDKIVSSNC